MFTPGEPTTRLGKAWLQGSVNQELEKDHEEALVIHHARIRRDLARAARILCMVAVEPLIIMPRLEKRAKAYREAYRHAVRELGEGFPLCC